MVEKDTHFGKLIEEIVRKNGRNVELEAIRWDYTANGLYRIFKKKDVGTDILKKVSNLYNIKLQTLIGGGGSVTQIGVANAANESTANFFADNGNKIKELSKR